MQKQPNIVMIVSDDQGSWAYASAGTKEIHSPNLDFLAHQGCVMQNLYCVSPVCSPARASLLTGQIPSFHGVHDWLRAGNSTIEAEYHQRLIDYLDGFPTFVEILAAHGYHCGLSGKWHLGNTHEPHRGFSYWQAYASGGGAYQSPIMIKNGEPYQEQGYISDIITQNALQFIETVDDKQPFYLSVHYTAPHAPWDEEQHKPQDFALYYPNCFFLSLPCPPMHPYFYNKDAFPHTQEARKRILSGYCAAITAMDHGIGHILAALQNRHLLEDTIIIFTSDNGMNMGHHGIYGKGNGTYPQNLFETSVKVPGIIMNAKTIPPARLDGIYSHYDFFPTILGLAGLSHAISPHLPGRNLTRILFDQQAEEQSYTVVFDEYGPNRMIRSGDWKYIHRYQGGHCELYNLRIDGGEENNLINHPFCQQIKATLLSQLERWFARHACPKHDGARLPVMGGGQIDRIGGEGVDGAIFVDHQDHLF